MCSTHTMSGLDLQSPTLLFWSVFIPSLHLLTLLLFRHLNYFPQSTRKGSRSSDIIAIEITSTVCVLWFSVIGSIGYLNLFGYTDGRDLYSTDRFYGYSSLAHTHLITPMFVYQIWNLFSCILHNEYRDLPSLGHHLVTAGLAYCGFYPFAHYYSLFYFGIAEVTTVPLNLVNTFKNIPQLIQTYPTLYQASRTIFAFSFFLIRLFWWPIISYELFYSCLNLIQSQKAHSLFIVNYFLFSNLFLTSLQFYWGYLILSNLFNRNKDKEKKEKKKEN